MDIFNKDKGSKDKDVNKQANSTPVQQIATSGSHGTGTSTLSAGLDTPNAAKPQHRAIYLLVWPNAKFKAHWGIFIPNLSDKTVKLGKYVHVEGSLDRGFEFQIVRGYDINISRRRPQVPIELGWVPFDFVVDTPTAKQQLVKEATPRDPLEEFLASIPAPTRSLNSVSGQKGVPSKPAKKPELSDCQWWVTKCIQALVEQGVLIPPQRGLSKNKDPLDALAAAPRHA